MSDKKKLMRDKLKAVIIGAGRIASDFDNPGDLCILTHAHAYQKHPRTELVGFYDLYKEKADQAAKKWGVKSYSNLEKMLNEVKPNLVSVCTPDEKHGEILKRVVNFKPSLVICEKPVTVSVAETKNIEDCYKDKNIPILMNFSRRFDSSIQSLKKDILNNKWGEVIEASGIYTKGINHNGSHLIDLARYFFGEIKKVKPIYFINDYNKKDKTVSGFLQFQRCPQFNLRAFDQRRYAIFEMDILFAKGRIKLYDSGFKISFQTITEDKMYKGFYSLSQEKIKKTKLDRAMYGLVNNAVAFLEKRSPLLCSLQEALLTQKICEKLLHNFNRYE